MKKINNKRLIGLIPKLVTIVLLLIIINTQLPQSVVSGSFEMGLIFALLALGIFISFRILDIPDLSVDGTFALGVAVSAINTVNGKPIQAIVIAVIAGALAGVVTGVLQTKLNVQPILAGIITMTGLYSINLRIMGQNPNISLYRKKTLFTMFDNILPKEYSKMIVAGVLLIVVAAVLYWFLKTQLGMSLRATGDNEFMVRASSINSDSMKIIGFAIANGLVALSGAILAQYQSFGDSNSGAGMLVIGLASIIIGEVIFGRSSIIASIVAAIVGAIAYRFILSFALQIGMEAIDLKLFSAIIVAIAISLPAIKKMIVTMVSRIKRKKGSAENA